VAPLQISTSIASCQRYCMPCSSGRQPKFAALNRGRHLHLAGRPSRWASARILVRKERMRPGHQLQLGALCSLWCFDADSKDIWPIKHLQQILFQKRWRRTGFTGKKAIFVVVMVLVANSNSSSVSLQVAGAYH